jgi:two-component system sensor histidine kinase KdpD
MAIENARGYTESLQARAELQRSTAAKDEFLGILAHELRTPITTIYGGARFLNSRGANVSEETRRQLTEAMQEDASKLNRLVENLLTLARTEIGQQIPREPVQMDKLLEGFVADYSRRRPGRQLLLRTPSQANGEPAIVEASPAYVEQILGNLVENSNKYSEIGLPIEIDLTRNGDEVQVVVRDRGPGIAAEEINLIFDSFYRSEKTARKAPGKGLGLAVCKRLVEAHCGRIWAQPRPGGGLEVGFALPALGGDEL